MMRQTARDTKNNENNKTMAWARRDRTRAERISLFQSAHMPKLASLQRMAANGSTRENKLRKAAEMGSTVEVAKLLTAKADLNCTANPHRDVPLMAAAEKGHTEIAILLLDHGAEVDLQDKVAADNSFRI